MADNQQNQQTQQAIREQRKKALEDNRKAMEEHRDERKKYTEAALKRMESSQPTPTQEENDLARIGIQVEKKADDKSGPTVITHTVVANEPLTAHGHETAETRERVEHARQQADQARQSGRPPQQPRP